MAFGQEREVKARRADQEWLCLEVDATGLNSRVIVGERHLTPFGRLYGGAGSALVSAAVEAATGRPLTWLTTQFVRGCRGGDLLALNVAVLAEGRNTSQVRVEARVGDELMLCAVGAAGGAVGGVPDHTVALPPDVPAPEMCPRLSIPVQGRSLGFFGLVEQRDADGARPDRHLSWMRVPGRPLTRSALLGLAGDCLAPMLTRAAGVSGGGASLDNTVRVGLPAESEWILAEGVPEQVAGGYGYGAVRLWSEGGVLVGSVSQTAALWHALE